MSIVIGYYGNNGAVVAGDRRNIMFRGNPEKRAELEKDLYCGKIKNEEELKNRAEELGVKIFIEDERTKVKKIGDVLVGEVKSIGADSKRRKMYLTKGNCAIVDILNDTITNKSIKNGSSIIIFGNKYLKDIVQKELKKYMNNFGKMDILDVKNTIENALKKCDGPTLSPELDILHTNKKVFNLEEIIEKDLNDLKEYRNDLKQKMIDFKKVMIIADKIENNGEVGIIKNGKLVLDDNHIAIDKVCPNPKLFNEIEIEGDVEDGDVVLIEDGSLKIKGKDIPLAINHIICKK
ncbi:DUF2121 family protein [Methanothermococcus okinawensis]|uniref:Uncharacterized conserved protein UCP019262 n=1 Tax=Methanothermococcus okinawensis (strain DSM 14208 / JCM 11175 / IH1) TaxID=647113 RepID=F8AM46_METOI|nr:DUF2121 domain-containing protein [Methanothermococcus okinawensis]AEH06731.1 Uncharacterized conserved protein UCP019262 [Methanothermococcus okinawensis IH1]